MPELMSAERLARIGERLSALFQERDDSYADIAFAVNSAREAAVIPRRAVDEIESHAAVLQRLLVRNLKAAGTKRPPAEVASFVFTFFHGACVEENLRPSVKESNRKIAAFLRIARTL